MNDYSYHTVSSIINAFKKSVNFPFKVIHDNAHRCNLAKDFLETEKLVQLTNPPY